MNPMDVMAGSYNYLLVVLSALIAVLASYSALNLAERITAGRGMVRLAWLISGSAAMGIGIWSMHYTAMLGFQLPVPVWYHWSIVLLCLLAGVAASAIALFTVSRTTLGWPAALAGSVLSQTLNRLTESRIIYSGINRIKHSCFSDAVINRGQ